MGRRRDAAKAAEWGRILEAWRENDLSIREFCELLDLREASFYAWRRKLSRTFEGASQRRVTRTCDDQIRPAQTAPQFIPLHVVGEERAVVGHVPFIEVELPSGIQLRVPQGCDRQTLCDLVAALCGEMPSC